MPAWPHLIERQHSSFRHFFLGGFWEIRTLKPKGKLLIRLTKLKWMHWTSQIDFNSGNSNWDRCTVKQNNVGRHKIQSVKEHLKYLYRVLVEMWICVFTSAKIVRHNVYTSHHHTLIGFDTVWQLLHSIAHSKALHNQLSRSSWIVTNASM